MKVSKARSYIASFGEQLKEEGKSSKTIIKYTGDIRIFFDWCDKNNIVEITQNNLEQYKQVLLKIRKIAGCNSVIISLNNFFKRYFNKEKLYITTVRVQKRASLDSVISVDEYELLLKTALKIKDYRTYCIIRVLASSGMRVSELSFLTVETLKEGKFTVNNKGKVRCVYLSNNICELLSRYCTYLNISSGLIFRSKKNPNKLIDKSQIWRKFKRLEEILNLKEGTIHAHCFRHFFAKQYINKFHDICELADILGHSNIETTRIYTRTTQNEKRNRIEQLGL